MNRSSSLRAALASSTAFALLGGGVAFADNLQDNLETSASTTQSISNGGSVTVTYRIGANGNDGCNVDASSPGTMALNLPSGVTADRSSLVFTQCSNTGTQTVTYSSSAAGTYDIRPTMSGGKLNNNGWNNNNAEFTLVVAAPAVQAQAALGVVAPDELVYGGTSPLSTTGGSGTGAVTWSARGGSCSVSGSTLTMEAGTGTCEVQASKAASTGFTAVASAWEDVTPVRKAIAGSFTAEDKTYDGTDAAAVAGRSVDSAALVGTDDLSLTGGTATFSSAAAGSGKTVILAGAALQGAKAGDYSLTSVGTTTADIARKAVTGSFTAEGKTYDGTDAATVKSRSVDPAALVGTDLLSLTGGTATFSSAAAGTGRTVSLVGATLHGAAAGNYSLISVGTTTADIAQKAVTGSFTAAGKTYDGGTAATVLGTSVEGAVAGDDVDLTGGDATFVDEDVAGSKTVTLTGASLSGTDAANYRLTGVGTTTAAITPRNVPGSFTAASKHWDGTTAAAVISRSLQGVVEGDDLSLTGGTAAFANADKGVAKPVTLTGAELGGTDAGNYRLGPVAEAAADIIGWNVTAFGSPVDSSADATRTVWNTVKGGSTVPFKFNVSADRTKTAAGDVSMVVTKVSCTGGTEDVVATGDLTTGSTTLRYDTTGSQWVYNFQTVKTAGTCYKVVAKAADGTTGAPSYVKTK